MGKENFQAGQLIPTSSTPPGNAGFYRIDKDTIGVVGNLVQKNANTNVESNVSTGANLAAELAAIGITSNSTFPLAQISGAEYSPWTKIDGGGNSSISASPVAGFAARLKTNSTVSGYVVAIRQIQPIVLAASDVVSFAINVPDASNTRSITLTLANDAGTTIRAYQTGYQMWHPGSNVVSFKFGDCILGGGATSATTWNYLRIDVTNPAFATEIYTDIGPVWVGGAARVPAVCITFDSGFSKVYDWAFPVMKANGIVGNVYALPRQVGVAGYMTQAKYNELYANGWDIGLYANVPGMGANNHTKDGITIAQSVSAGGSFSINGTLASGGSATLNPPRIVTAYIASGVESTNAYTITGTAVGGGAQVELLQGPSGSATKSYTKNVFASVASITALNATSVSVSFGTGFTQDEYIAEFALQRQWLTANGFNRGWAHLAYSLGEYNNESEQWVRKCGFRTARTVLTGATIFRNAARGVPINPLFMPCSVTIGDPASFATIQTQVNAAITRGFDVFILGHLSDAQVVDTSELNAAVAWLGSLHRAGTIRVMSFSEYESAAGV